MCVVRDEEFKNVQNVQEIQKQSEIHNFLKKCRGCSPRLKQPWAGSYRHMRTAQYLWNWPWKNAALWDITSAREVSRWSWRSPCKFSYRNE
jgi:hypothetical protein